MVHGAYHTLNAPEFKIAISDTTLVRQKKGSKRNLRREMVGTLFYVTILTMVLQKFASQWGSII